MALNQSLPMVNTSSRPQYKRVLLLLISKLGKVGNIGSNIHGRVLFWLNDIRIEAGLRFFGRAHFKVARSAKVKIGAQVVFRSGARSNLIGINRPCIISVHPNGVLAIGKRCGFSGTVIGCFEKITIEDDVRCGANTTITDSDWHLGDPRSGKPSPVHIHRNVWLGAGVMVLKGVSIGENSVIGAGSVVTRSIPANVVATGNPCKVIKSIVQLTDYSLKTYE